MKIQLPHGGRDASFPLEDLVEHVRSTGRGYVIVGGQNRLLAEHTKPNSLDYWLRTRYARTAGTKQATKAVVADLVATGRFEVRRRACPDSGRVCKALALHSAEQR